MASEGRRRIIEEGPGFGAGLKSFIPDTNSKTITAAVIASVFGCTGPVILCMSAATSAGFSPAEVNSWVWAVYVFGGSLGVFLSLKYKQPISGAWSIPGAVMLSSSLVGYSFNEAAFAFIIAGVIVFLLGITGLVGKVMKFLPLPIVQGMIAGALLRFGTGIFTNTFGANVLSTSAPILGGAAMLGYFLLPKLIKRIPPALAALICGTLATVLIGEFDLTNATFEFIGPMLVTPEVNLGLILSVSIPLAILVIGAENAQAMGVLISQGYKAPANAMTVFSGIGGIITGFFGGANANIAGPMTAICAGEEAGENKSQRYTAAVWNSIVFALCGVFIGFLLAFINLIPGTLVSVISGLAMMGVLIGALSAGFGTGYCKYGSFIAMMVAASGITLFSIGSTFWALLGGLLVSFLMEKKDFKTLRDVAEAKDK